MNPLQLDAIPELANEDYVEAQTLGRAHGNCTQYYDACPISIFQVSLDTISDSN